MIDSSSHGREGVGYVLIEQGILLPGDNLSAITIPLLADSLADARRSTEHLLAALDHHTLRHVVPGHGPVLTPEGARRIGEQDLRYLERLDAAAAEAVSEGLGPGTPSRTCTRSSNRKNTIDFEIYGIHGGNARVALREHGFDV